MTGPVAFEAATLRRAGLGGGFGGDDPIVLRVGRAPRGARPRLRFEKEGAVPFEVAFHGGAWWTEVTEPPVQALALRAILAHRLGQAGALLLHASAVVQDGGAWLFLGPGNAGKTTLARQARGLPIGDDAVAVFQAGGRVYAQGTPFSSEGGPPGHDAVAEVAGVLLLEKDRTDCVERVPRREVVRVLLQQLFLPPGTEEPNPAQVRTLLGLAAGRVGRLHFRRDCVFDAAGLLGETPRVRAGGGA